MLIDAYGFRLATITKIVREAPRAVSIQLTVDKEYRFAVGQHAVVRVTMPSGTTLVRQYSFSASPSNHEIWLTVVHEPHGEVSGWFNEAAKKGDTVELSHPFSGPVMQKIPRGEICIIAGGSGIAPFRAHMQELRQQNRAFTLLYSTRSDELCFTSELTPLPKEVIAVRCTDREARFTKSEVIRPLTAHSSVFICGSRPFVVAMRNYCETIVPSERIYAEAFSL